MGRFNRRNCPKLVRARLISRSNCWKSRLIHGRDGHAWTSFQGMRFPSSLKRGVLIKRYKRFLSDVTLDTGETITATCPNTGSMRGLCEPGTPVWVSVSDSPTRKYKHTWELVENDAGRGNGFVGINTHHPNKIVSESIEKGRIKSLKGYGTFKREQKYGENSRIDILLDDEAKGRVYIEVKNVTMMRKPGLAEFPDAVTARGAKHLEELGNMVDEGHRSVMLYLIQRTDATRFTLAQDIDPNYWEAFCTARKRGVEALAYVCDISTEGISIARSVPLKV